MTATVVVGHSKHDGKERTVNFRWVMARYQAHGYPVHVGVTAARTWVKAAAFNRTVAAVDTPVVVVADADCVVSRGALAQAVIDASRDGYAVPAKVVHRLTPDASADVLSRDPSDDIGDRLDCEGKHQLLAGGGIIVVARDLWHTVGGFDARFSGWGGEDFALGCALYAFTGQYPRRQPGVMHHLWHPPQTRQQRLTPANERLANRYRAAKFDRAAMAALIGER